MSDLMSATLIYDQLFNAMVPAQLMPEGGYEACTKAGQLLGTPMERLCEIAGRACYDSFGRGRNSADFHKHILEVGHLSVIEHAVFTVELSGSTGGVKNALQDMFNRPSLWVNMSTSTFKPRITLNLRHVLEWERSQNPNVCTTYEMAKELCRIAHILAPNIVPYRTSHVRGSCVLTRVTPETDEEKWVTLLLTGSRGFSHELCRHGDWTAISQRSTRYVNESESPWVRHPLEIAWVDANIIAGHLAVERAGDLVGIAQHEYAEIVHDLEAWIIARGVDKTTARKQARGAARGYLGNALYTEVVFSASVAQWKHMLRMRASAAADAEIRQVFCQALGELKKSQYADCFDGLGLAPSPDGIGHVLTALP